ncbi:hypothetical protein M885DRAFT_545624 [Pelagophyceae sp. CCMP2097]|nr:hypothetical protein M885DRAFT_545624 [Pelagophyceae sp. CCMP2097]
MEWKRGVRDLVRRHAYNFDAAATECGATPKEIRMELARLEFGGDDEAAPAQVPAPARPSVAAAPAPTMEIVAAPPHAADEAPWDAERFLDEERQRTRAARAARDKVFERVLTSLGGGAPLGGAAETAGGADPTVDAWRAARAAEAREDEAREARRAVDAETRALDAQRETLRRRFEPGSADALGLDPLAESAAAGAANDDAPAQPARGLDFSGLDAALDALEAEAGEGVACSSDLEDLFRLMDSAPRAPKALAPDNAADERPDLFDHEEPERPPRAALELKAASPPKAPSPPKTAGAARTMGGAPRRGRFDVASKAEDVSDGEDGDYDDDWRQQRQNRKHQGRAS